MLGQDLGPVGAKVSSAACVCDLGYYFVATSNNCAECAKGSYKDEAGNAEACVQCDAGNTTFDTGAVARSACVPEVQDAGGTGETSSGVQTPLQNSSEVPAVSFNMSFANLPADTDLQSLRSQLIAPRMRFHGDKAVERGQDSVCLSKAMFLATFSASARVDPNAIQIAAWHRIILSYLSSLNLLGRP